MLAKLFSILRQQTLGAVALFVALGGTSFAVATGSIDSREIKNNTVRSKDIRNNDIRSKDVRNGSLLARDFKLGQLPAGPQGPKGVPGTPGTPGVSGYQRVVNSHGPDTTQVKTVTATCPSGKRPVGGGYIIDTGSNDSVLIDADGPFLGSGDSWVVRATNSEVEEWDLFVVAICATVAS